MKTSTREAEMHQSKPSKAKRAAQDDSIMGTNNSSIVSKRSVERLYFPEPHFFRYFVKKPQRRSPLINRGYWLRMYAVERIVQKFLQEPTEERKVVINLGCGYDALAFQMLEKANPQFGNPLFVDVDYPQLINKKTEIILATPQLHDLLGHVRTSANSEIVRLRSDSYLAVGCDLRDLEQLQCALSKELELSKCIFLLTAEVSVTYMDVEAADALIAWAAKLEDARFCLLEQSIPNGANHPFAKTMINHFNKLQTPLKSIHRYPCLEDQRRRFLGAGWSSAAARNLWDLWSDDAFLTAEQRIQLNAVEPFDEWEEFALFACHYFLLLAVNGSTYFTQVCQLGDSIEADVELSDGLNAIPGMALDTFPNLQWKHLAQAPTQRRYGAISYASNDTLGHHGGLGAQRRLQSTDVYALANRSPSVDPRDTSPPSVAIEARMCHTITEIGSSCYLLVGGRGSPDHALADCWLRSGKEWDRVEDLPSALYRHCATPVRAEGEPSRVLVYGGRSNHGAVMNDWLLWKDSDGWKKLDFTGDSLKPRFGAAIVTLSSTAGIMLGGIGEDGTVLPELWQWSIENLETNPRVIIENQSHQVTASSLLSYVVFRFGASLVWSQSGLLLVGGISGRMLLQDRYDVVGLIPSRGENHPKNFMLQPSLAKDPSSNERRHLLVGHTTTSYADGIVTVGGGAVCFSFGTYWNTGIWLLDSISSSSSLAWELLDQPKSRQSVEPKVPHHEAGSKGGSSQGSASSPITVSTERIKKATDFERIIRISKPAVLQELHLGSCVEKWTWDYLKNMVNSERPVVVHEAATQHMSFQSKNFRYTTKPFGVFLDDISSGAKQYLRSLALEKPTDRPADFAIDYPEIAPDFQLPEELQMVREHAHSSVLRISGPVAMWLHYDVMANILCQIRGTKRLLLFPPSDILYLGIPPGASSSSIDVFGSDSSGPELLTRTHPQEAVLHPGDVLFIPPLWAHTASPTERTSVAVNVFFRSLQTGYAAGRDVYGNRDLQAYERGRKDLEKITKAFDGLPPDIGRFYMERLAEELRANALDGKHSL